MFPVIEKTLRGMRTRAKQELVAEATALGAGVPQAELQLQICYGDAANASGGGKDGKNSDNGSSADPT